MTIEFYSNRVTFETETLPAPERSEMLSEMAVNSVHFVSSLCLCVDKSGQILLATNSTVIKELYNLEDTIRVIKVSASHYLVDRSYTQGTRDLNQEHQLHRIEELNLGNVDPNNIGYVIGIIDNPGEFELAAPIIAKQFGIKLQPLDLDEQIGFE